MLRAQDTRGECFHSDILPERDHSGIRLHVGEAESSKLRPRSSVDRSCDGKITVRIPDNHDILTIRIGRIHLKFTTRSKCWNPRNPYGFDRIRNNRNTLMPGEIVLLPKSFNQLGNTRADNLYRNASTNAGIKELVQSFTWKKRARRLADIQYFSNMLCYLESMHQCKMFAKPSTHFGPVARGLVVVIELVQAIALGHVFGREQSGIVKRAPGALGCRGREGFGEISDDFHGSRMRRTIWLSYSRFPIMQGSFRYDPVPTASQDDPWNPRRRATLARIDRFDRNVPSMSVSRPP